jgi:HNH endonuclease
MRGSETQRAFRSTKFVVLESALRPGGGMGQTEQNTARRLRAEPEWAQAHATLTTLAKDRAALDGREAVLLLRVYRARVHVHLGHGSFAEYVERTLGYGARTTEDRLRTALALERLPLLATSLNEGEIHWTAVRELARVATAETEAEWLSAVRMRTLREIERLVSGHIRGDRPGDAPRPEARRHVLRFEVDADTLATFREAVKRLRHDSDERLDDDDILLLMARRVLGAPSADEGARASYQIALTVCSECTHGTQQAGADDVPVEPAVIEMAKCDAQHIGPLTTGQTNPTHVGAPTARATQTIPPALRRRVVRRDRSCCVVPGCRNSTFVDVHHIKPRAEGGRHAADNLVVLCSAHHRAVHRGVLVIGGSVGNGLEFQRADQEELPPPREKQIIQSFRSA